MRRRQREQRGRLALLLSGQSLSNPAGMPHLLAALAHGFLSPLHPTAFAAVTRFQTPLPLPPVLQALAEMEAAAGAAPLLHEQLVPLHEQLVAPHDQLAALAVLPPGAKVCENCGTTSTPLWRKDRATGMMMCNACGIFFKHHQKHRPVELAMHPHHRAPPHPQAPHPHPARPTSSVEASDGEDAQAAPDASWEPHPQRRRTSPAAGSDESEQSEDEDGEGRRRSLRPRRARAAAEEYLQELRAGGEAGGAAAVANAAAGAEEPLDAGAYDSEAGERGPRRMGCAAGKASASRAVCVPACEAFLAAPIQP